MGLINNLIKINTMKKIFLTSLIVIVGVLMFGQLAFASGTTTLSALPVIATSTAGEAFSISVKINPKDDKVCVVMGTILLDNLNCQSISLNSGVIAQTTPTCEAPNFTLGIPKCTSSTQDLFSVSVKGEIADQAVLSFANVKVIGVGVDVPFVSENAFYDIFADNRTISSTTSSTTDTVTDNDGDEGDDEGGDSEGEDVNTEDDSADVTATSTGKEVPSKLSGLSASALAAISYSFNFVKGNLFTLLFSIIGLILLGGIFWFLVIRKKE